MGVIFVSNSRRYASTISVFCGLNDFHNIVGAVTERFAPTQTLRIKQYGSFEKFTEPEFLYDIAYAPFQVMEIFNDIKEVSRPYDYGYDYG